MVFRTIAGNTLQYLIPQKCIKRALNDCSVLLDKNWQSVSEWVWSVAIFMYLLSFLFLWIVLHITVMDVSSSGWTTFKDEGSTEPDHRPATIHNQSGKFSLEVGLILWRLLNFQNLSNIGNVVDDCLCTAHALSQAKHPVLSEKRNHNEVKENIASFGTNGRDKRNIFTQMKNASHYANTRMCITHERWLVKVYDLPYAKFA